jgi:hypothetical protein
MREVPIAELVSAVTKSLSRGRFVAFDYIKSSGERGQYVHGAIPLDSRDFKCEPKPLFHEEKRLFTVWCVTRKGFRSFKAETLVSATVNGEVLVPILD